MDQETKVIEVRNMYKKFGDFVANDDLSFDVYKGEIFGFLELMVLERPLQYASYVVCRIPLLVIFM